MEAFLTQVDKVTSPYPEHRWALTSATLPALVGLVARRTLAPSLLVDPDAVGGAHVRRRSVRVLGLRVRHALARRPLDRGQLAARRGRWVLDQRLHYLRAGLVVDPHGEQRDAAALVPVEVKQNMYSICNPASPNLTTDIFSTKKEARQLNPNITYPYIQFSLVI